MAYTEFDDMVGGSAHEVNQERATAARFERLEKLNQRFDEFFGEAVPTPAIRPTGRRLSSGRDFYVEEPSDPLSKFMDESDQRPAQETLPTRVSKVAVLPPAPRGQVWARADVGEPWKLLTPREFVKACGDYTRAKVR